MTETTAATPSPAPLAAPDGGRWPVAPERIPAAMRAVAFDRFGPPEVLVPTTVPTPVIGEDEVLVRVAAVSVGRLLDTASRAGRHPFQGFVLPHVLGAEHAGTVAAVGSDVSHVGVGDHVAIFPVIACGQCRHCRRGRSEGCDRLRIIGVHRQGAYADYTGVPARNVRRVPVGVGVGVGVGVEHAAALALAGPVAMNQLEQAGFQRGDRVLVQGAASALGSLTAALVQHLGGRVIGTSRSAAKRAALLKAGVEVALDPTAPDAVDRIRAATGGDGVEIAIDNLGDPGVFAVSVASLGVLGSVVTSGAFLGGNVELDLKAIYLDSQRIIGVRTGTPASADRLWAEVEAGFRPLLDRVFPLEDAARAHEYLEADGNTGRVVLTTGDEEQS